MPGHANTTGRWRFLLGLILGAGLILCCAGESPERSLHSEQNRETVFGGVKLSLRHLNMADMPAVKQILTVYRDDVPIVVFFLDGEGQIVGYAGVDGNRKFLRAMFDGNRLSTFVVYGSQGTPTMFGEAGDRGDGWESVTYVETTHEHDAAGDLLRYRPLGEMYLDLDFDGQFDARDVYNAKSERLSQWVLLDGGWKCLGIFDPPRDWRQPGYYSVSDRRAICIEDGEEHELHFENGVGWKKRPAPAR